MLDWLIYSVAGKLAIFFFQSFPLPSKLEEHWFIGKLHKCGLCSGFYIFSILAYFLKMDILTSLGFWYTPVLSEVVTGMSISFITHLVTLGWKEQFNSVVII